MGLLADMGLVAEAVRPSFRGCGASLHRWELVAQTVGLVAQA